MSGERQSIEVYARTLETLTQDTIGRLTELCSPDVHFADPFNDVQGREAMAHVFRDMFDKLDDIGFWTSDIAGTGPVWMLRYRFTASGGMVGRLDVPGMSFLRLGEDGLVAEHVDYWDGGAIYERIPVLGPAVRAVKRRISA